MGGRLEVVIRSNLLLGPGSEVLAYGPPSPSMFVHNQAYHSQTQLLDGRKSLLIDPGSVGNLCGDKWAKEMAQEAARNGRKPSYTKRQRPLKVSGVGNGAQACQYDCMLPVAFRQEEEQQPREGHISIPTVSGSELPGLLGLTALRKNRAILDLHTMKMYFAGPGDYNLLSALPPRNRLFPSRDSSFRPHGHSVLRIRRARTDTARAQPHTNGKDTEDTTRPGAKRRPRKNTKLIIKKSKSHTTTTRRTSAGGWNHRGGSTTSIFVKQNWRIQSW